MIALIFIVTIVYVIICLIEKKEPEPEQSLVIPKEENVLTAKLTEPYLTLENYIGQHNNIDYLMGHIVKAKKSIKPLPHIILWGNGGLGKSTLIKAVSYEMGGRFIEIIPANLRTTKDLFSIFFKRKCPSCGWLNPYSSNKCLYCKESIQVYYTPEVMIQENDILFLEECHGLKSDIEEALYSLMQDGYVMMRYNGIDQRVLFPKITIAGATTKLGDLNKPFRDRFKIEIHLEPYSEEEIKIISRMYCENKQIDIDEESLNLITTISFGIPRIAKKYLDDSTTRGEPVRTDIVKEIMNILLIDENGLNNLHRKILDYIHIRGQAGVAAIAGSVGLSKEIYEEVYEPALMYKELIWLSSRGRVITDKAKKLYYLNCGCKQCTK